MHFEQLSVSKKAILMGLFLSKFDKDGLNALGFTGFWEAFNTLAYAIAVKPATIKNYRDEFDPYFPNLRRGWHGRPMKGYCQPVFDEFSTLCFGDFTDLIKRIAVTDYLPQESQIELTSHSESVAKRLITGRSAEEYFRLNYQTVPCFSDHDIKDTTLMGCGYDFEVNRNGLRQFSVEVKGLAKTSGSIMLTEKEFYVAGLLKEQYCLFIVSNFDKKPQHKYHFNPLHSQLNFKRGERQVTQVTYSATV